MSIDHTHSPRAREPATSTLSARRPRGLRPGAGVALLAAVFLAAGGAQAADAAGTAASSAAAAHTQGATQSDAAPTALRGKDKLAHADASFLKDAAQNNQAEIKGSEMALEKARNAQTKAFAQQMLNDHRKAGQELERLAAAKGVDLPDDASLMQKAKLELLNLANDKDFDRMYAESVGVKAHKDTIELFRKAAQEAKDPDVRAFATRTLPTLEHHLQEAHELPGAPAEKSAAAR
ncbi:DUF4142 domain-containing protein [Comamonas sp. NLF-1-9]|uniref:DUF4142 domain-containing protein n=1 Tax=Comamonas sp. NLF-1-9 TaxID=2853163 RepID=UPI001C4975FB|nr:DUF4142 domain-containing protein [Comamonas sp. NLF-1-9]QXL85304.1 DUF4142 domain-containing protein [Comamonas sp. NLF-1-9]